MIHGRLANKDGNGRERWRTANLDMLVATNLYSAFPGLGNNDQWHLLPRRVKDLRFQYFEDTYHMTPWSLERIRVLAKCFRSSPQSRSGSQSDKDSTMAGQQEEVDAFEAAMMIALVAIKSRSLLEHDMLNLLAALPNVPLPSVPDNLCVDDLRNVLQNLKEATQFGKMLRLLYEMRLDNINKQLKLSCPKMRCCIITEGQLQVGF